MIARAKLTASMEDYLEVISHLITEGKVARAKDIAKRMKVRRASVTGALKSLAEKKLINHEPYAHVTLTAKGEKVAREIIRRHEVLREFFSNVLSVEEKEAETTACKMEHVISNEILERLVEFIEFMELCPLAGAKWVEGFGYYCNHGDTNPKCDTCLASCITDLKKTKEHKKEKVKVTKTLNELQPGEKGKIIKIAGSGPIKKRIIDMGVITGSLISVKRIAPMGDPIETRVKGYSLSLRKTEAATITVEML